MAVSNNNSEYVCTLSEDLVKQAEEELNEKPQWRSRDIQALRDMVNKRADLKIRTDDAFLLRFLRAKKFDYDRAFNLIVRHYEMKADERNKQLFTNLRPASVKHVLEAGVTGVLPHRDKLGRRVIMFRPGRWDPSKYPLDDIFKTNFLTLSKLVEEEPTQVTGIVMMMDLNGMGFAQAKNISPFYAKRVASLLQEPEAQITGIVLVTDFKSFGWKHARRLKPLYAKRMIKILQDCFPMRFKGIHYLNEPAIFDYIFAIVRPFLKEKILSRVRFHGNKYEELLEFLEPEHLPSDYGGKAPPYTNEDWMKTLLESDAYFDSQEKFGLATAAGKPETSRKEDALDCLAGSYRKLDI
ncbi:alpha-tocopherol transfer protein-like isoform X1 [Mya arenaria]|uniref:alpha-tocopherol transfer protein-like isoform X1 n=1 Tax=Mya arenaria TaxID=6604 RepID=UPI0022E73A47|nr:alpha-tocopherol transfer protein-like isoform X1 [Mya arenaria]XP_052762895.1 alpha-tocopherol transfer protein-like isoform X1 [Mya arenaria]